VISGDHSHGAVARSDVKDFTTRTALDGSPQKNRVGRGFIRRLQ